MLRTITLFCAIVSVTASVSAADARDEVKAAAKKLGEAHNYAWKSTQSIRRNDEAEERMNLTIEGKAVGEMVWLTNTYLGNTTEVLVKPASEKNKGAVKTDEGWRSFAELIAASREAPIVDRNRFMGVAMRMQSFKAPALEAEDITSKVKELKRDGETFAGELTEDGAKGLLFPPGPARDAKDGKGTVKFWVKDGQLTKYEYKVQGNLPVRGQDRVVNRTVTIEIKDVGTTKLDVPEEAKKAAQ